jgi:hypothetical protein
MSSNRETLAQPEPADYVNDVPDCTLCRRRRCQHAEIAAEYRAAGQGRPCGYPSQDEQAAASSTGRVDGA